MGPNFLPQAYANPRWLYFGFLGKQRTKGKCVSIGTLRNSVCQPPTNLLAEEMTMQADLPIAAIDASFTSLFLHSWSDALRPRFFFTVGGKRRGLFANSKLM
jgi:hypothetical protein